MNASALFTLAFAVALLSSLATRYWLATRQARHVARHRDTVPAGFASTVSLPAHQKAADYTLAKARVDLLEIAFGAAVLLGWTLLGALDALNQALLAVMGGGMGQQLALLAAFAVIGGLLDLPFSWYRTFVVEERFGFNKTTPALWAGDILKGTLVGAVIGLPIAALILWLMGAAGHLWWLWAWGTWVAFNLLLLVIYPGFIAPIFNKFQPLQDEALATRVKALMQRCGFTAKGFFVMDGSRRSAHANAYFTGFGAAKRVVFYDTLLAKLSPAEVDAVLGWVSGQVWFYTGLGVRPNLEGANDALALLLFMLVVPVFTFFISPLFARLSRRHEFEADAYAAAQTNGADLGSALTKLYEDNASTLTPDPLFVAFYYSHPPAGERLARLGVMAPAAS